MMPSAIPRKRVVGENGKSVNDRQRKNKEITLGGVDVESQSGIYFFISI